MRVRMRVSVSVRVCARGLHLCLYVYMSISLCLIYMPICLCIYTNVSVGCLFISNRNVLCSARAVRFLFSKSRKVVCSATAIRRWGDQFPEKNVCVLIFGIRIMVSDALWLCDFQRCYIFAASYDVNLKRDRSYIDVGVACSHMYAMKTIFFIRASVSRSASKELIVERRGAERSIEHSPWWGGGLLRTHLRFFPDCKKKKRGEQRRRFCTPYLTSFPYMLCKLQTQVTQDQVTRSRQVTSPHKKFEWSSKLHRLNDCLETFSDWYK